MTIQIAVTDVSFAYQPEWPVLQRVSVSFSPGATAVIGQNGAGKTTLMKMLNGLIQPNSGDVRIDGVSTRHRNPADVARQVGLVFQNPDDQIFKHRVLDEVMFGPLNIGKSADDARELAKAALREVGLESTIDANPYDLGYGDRKLVCVASILAMDTPVVVFDEPTISQDARGIARIGGIIRDLARRGKTVIAIVHDMNFSAEYFETVVVMAEGRVLASGRPADIFSQTDVLRQAHVDAPAMAQLSLELGLSQVCTGVDEFVDEYRQERMR